LIDQGSVHAEERRDLDPLRERREGKEQHQQNR
jgi:hypothetical protein